MTRLHYVAVFIIFVFILLLFFLKLYYYFCKVSGFSGFIVTARDISGGIFTGTGLSSTKEWAGDTNPSVGGSCEQVGMGRAAEGRTTEGGRSGKRGVAFVSWAYV